MTKFQEKRLKQAYAYALAQTKTFTPFMHDDAFYDFHGEIVASQISNMPHEEYENRVLDEDFPIRRTDWFGSDPLHKSLMVDINAIALYKQMDPHNLNADEIFRGYLREPVALIIGLTDIINNMHAATPEDYRLLSDLTLLRWYLWQTFKK